jgi:hypothetical protein
VLQIRVKEAVHLRAADAGRQRGPAREPTGDLNKFKVKNSSAASPMATGSSPEDLQNTAALL